MDDYTLSTARHNAPHELKLSEIRSLCRGGRLIPLINEVRMFSGLGLKDAKNAVEAHMTSNNTPRAFNSEKIIELLEKYAANPRPRKLENEEIINIIREGLDNMDKLWFTDQLEVIEIMIKNIRASGGLDAITKERRQFIDAI